MHGAEAVVFQCRFFSAPAICKKRLPKRYRVPALDASIRRQRTKLEARIMHRAKSTGVLCPLVLFADQDKCEIIQSRLTGEKLVDYVKKNNASIVLRKAGIQLAKLHEAGISHGDSTTSNFMVCGGEVYAFDFGLSRFNASSEEKAIDLLLFSKSVSKEQFADFFRGYSSQSTDADKLVRQMHEIQSRARYVER
ncbi:Kae1-associated serine/threonine protein kinase [Candidatus Micrarchaeota archaeon]|nr:Kae1-associated serine/threonine protein kinase [Candidatus Micrarchaeota archaeon]